MTLTYKIKSKLLRTQCPSGFGPAHPSCLNSSFLLKAPYTPALPTCGFLDLMCCFQISVPLHIRFSLPSKALSHTLTSSSEVCEAIQRQPHATQAFFSHSTSHIPV